MAGGWWAELEGFEEKRGCEVVGVKLLVVCAEGCDD